MGKSESKNTGIFTFEVTKGLTKEIIEEKLTFGKEIAGHISFKKYRQDKNFGFTEDSSHKNDNNQNYLVYLNKSTSTFFEAIFLSYSNHYNLKLSVSHFIVAIGQALAIHINENSELLRKEFVSFGEKKEIKVLRDEFKMGEQNDWTTVFEEFSEQIKQNTNVDLNKVIIDDTSIATQTSIIVSQICLMDAMKSYFDFTLSTRCGIPKVSLIGSNDDWKKLKDKVDHLCKLNENNRLKLDWWLQYLVPVIDNIVNTAVYGKIDTSFWQNLAKIDNGSGGPYFQGWINVFFPYLTINTGGYRINTNMDYKVNHRFSGLKDDEVPQGISIVPFIWDYLGEKHNMNLYGGFFATKVNEEESSVEPELGWMIERKMTLKK